MTPIAYRVTYNTPIGGGYPDDTGTYDVPAHGRTPAQMLADHMRHLCACADLVAGDADYCDTVTVGADGRYRPDTDADVWAGWWWTVTDDTTTAAPPSPVPTTWWVDNGTTIDANGTPIHVGDTVRLCGTATIATVAAIMGPTTIDIGGAYAAARNVVARRADGTYDRIDY